jgi:uncharacterized protein
MLLFANAEEDRNKVVSALAHIEARSSICRLRKGKAISSAEATSALDLLSKEIRRINEQSINLPVIEAANALVDTYALRALDAVQLGCAMVARDLFTAPDMRFIASDKALLDAAKREGFGVWNPSTLQ